MLLGFVCEVLQWPCYLPVYTYIHSSGDSFLLSLQVVASVQAELTSVSVQAKSVQRAC